MNKATSVAGFGLIVFAVLATSHAAAELVVLYDSGQSWPIDRYLAPIVDPRRAQVPADRTRASGERVDAYLKQVLPVRSPSLTPGPVIERLVKVSGARGFFLIGSEARSLRWLARHRDRLTEYGAVGLLVEASTEADFRAVARIARGLPVAPASGEAIAAALGVQHYPFAVTDGRLWQ